MIKHRHRASGYTLIEVLLALVILMVLVQVIGSSLVTVLSIERQAAQARELSDLSQLLATEALMGVDKNTTISEWSYSDWKPGYDLIKMGRAPAVTLWHEWSLTARNERVPRLRIYVAQKPSE